MSETPELSPETFDFDEWFADANLPTESADIYTRADVVGDIRDLERRIELEAAIADEAGEDPALAAERPLTQKAPKPDAKVAKLIAERNRLFKQFEGSKITVHVRALTGTERKAILDAHNATKTEETPKEPNEEFTFRALSQSIVAMQKSRKTKSDATLSIDQVRNLYRKVGDAQIKVIFDAYLVATNALPEVSADFLPEHSSPETTQE